MNGDRFYSQWYYGKKKIGPKVWFLAVLITSFFYCLPLGRYSVGIILTDFRLFDFIIVIFILTVGINLIVRADPAWKSRAFFTRQLRWLIILVIIGLMVTALYNFNRVLPASIRTFRFLSYLYVGLFTMLIVDTHERFKFICWIIVVNIAVQATIAFFQALGFLPSLWPEYWRLMYAENDAPVATLSPHHKHIGVVMLVGLALFLAMFKIYRNWFSKGVVLLAVLFSIMVPLFSGTRTFLLGMAFFILAYFLRNPQEGAFLTAIVIVFIALFFYSFNLQGVVTEKLEAKYNQRIQSRIDKFGYEGLYRDRLFIYERIPEVIAEHPQLVLTGTGFQNVISFIGANGAHNNFLEAFLELGLLGLLVFLGLITKILKNLRASSRIVRTRFEKIIIDHTWIAFVGLIGTMLVGETLWGQPAMFTLTGQIMALIGLCISPYYRFVVSTRRKHKKTAPPPLELVSQAH